MTFLEHIYLFCFLSHLSFSLGEHDLYCAILERGVALGSAFVVGDWTESAFCQRFLLSFDDSTSPDKINPPDIFSPHAMTMPSFCCCAHGRDALRQEEKRILFLVAFQCVV